MNLKFTFAASAVFILLGTGQALSAQAPGQPATGATEAAPPKTVAATVNGQPIYEEQLVPLVKAGLAKFNKFDPAKITPETKGRLRRQALERAIETELIYQAGKKDLQIPDFEAQLSRKMAEIKNHPSEKMGRMSDAELREHADREIYIGEYMKKKGLTSPEVAEEEIKALYQKNKEGFVQKENALTRHILVQVADDATAEEKQKARSKIEEARKQILDGKPFEEVAKEYSEDKNAASGGNLGYMEKGYMPPEFDAVAFSIEPETLSGIIETKFGFHILEVQKKTPRGYVPYEQARDFLKKYLQNQAAKNNRISHMKNLRESSEIVIFEGAKEQEGSPPASK